MRNLTIGIDASAGKGSEILKKRLISSFFALVFLVLILIFYNTIFLNIVIAAIALFSIYEIFVATKYVNIKSLTTVSYIYVLIFPFLSPALESKIIPYVMLAFGFILFLILMGNHENETFEQIGLVFMISTVLPLALSTIIYIRDQNNNHFFFYIFIILISSFGADTGAFFAGKFFGKRKLAPKISPKKTIEGAIGGVVLVAILVIVEGVIYSTILKNNLNIKIKINYILLVLISIVAAILGIIGDLSASIIKRKCAVKDFGDIMPGHGGVLDRIDSLLFVSPFIYVLLHFVKLIK